MNLFGKKKTRPRFERLARGFSLDGVSHEPAFVPFLTFFTTFSSMLRRVLRPVRVKGHVNTVVTEVSFYRLKSVMLFCTSKHTTLAFVSAERLSDCFPFYFLSYQFNVFLENDRSASNANIFIFDRNRFI